MALEKCVGLGTRSWVLAQVVVKQRRFPLTLFFMKKTALLTFQEARVHIATGQL
jgi:hypothetical protein